MRSLSQIELARRLRITQTTVSLIERGYFHPDDALLGRLATILEVFPPFLLLLPVEEVEETEQAV
jgi:transcriptional regulator with XRE-family HTH domain